MERIKPMAWSLDCSKNFHVLESYMDAEIWKRLSLLLMYLLFMKLAHSELVLVTAHSELMLVTDHSNLTHAT